MMEVRIQEEIVIQYKVRLGSVGQRKYYKVVGKKELINRLAWWFIDQKYFMIMNRSDQYPMLAEILGDDECLCDGENSHECPMHARDSRYGFYAKLRRRLARYLSWKIFNEPYPPKEIANVQGT